VLIFDILVGDVNDGFGEDAALNEVDSDFIAILLRDLSINDITDLDKLSGDSSSKSSSYSSLILGSASLLGLICPSILSSSFCSSCFSLSLFIFSFRPTYNGVTFA
jgi:hypothetical protein